jgi:hypothetical protein
MIGRFGGDESLRVCGESCCLFGGGSSLFCSMEKSIASNRLLDGILGRNL